MSDLAAWQKNNEAYLAVALSWLRLRLASTAPPAPTIVTPGEPAPQTVEPASSSGRWWSRQKAQPASAAVPAPPGAPPIKLLPEANLAQAAADMTAAESADPPPLLVILGQRFGLSKFERQILLLCAAMELDTRIAWLCARAQEEPARSYPTFALALALLDEPAWDALSPERPLRFWRLIEINQPGAQPLTTSALRIDERILNYIKGLNYLDDRLSTLLTPLETVDRQSELPASQQTTVETIVSRLRQSMDGQRLPIIQLLGPDTPSKQLVAQQAAANLGLHLYRLQAGSLPTQTAELETLARLWQRESLLLPVAMYLDAYEPDASGTPDSQMSPLIRYLSRADGVTFLDTREVQSGPGWERLRQFAILLDVAKPTPAEQQAAWAAELTAPAIENNAAPETTEATPKATGDVDTPAMLAGQFSLGLATIRQIARSVLAEMKNVAPDTNAPSLHDRLWDACLMSTRPRLDTLAQRLNPKATWNDIVLPGEAVDLLHQIASQVGRRSKVYEDWGFYGKMNRGLGISALFTGESGTGKTMAAEVIANDLRLNLYRIDLSAVVSKYIGETEKNLRRLFDAAEDGGAILFFDEADALFGKRSEVKDSHDRYANIEINYLLQRMEAYRGLAILATNMKSALDPAFMRRLRFIVSFSFPGPAERQTIWQKVFPQQTPTGVIDFERLARLNLTGGSIQNIALNAAFLAARDGSPVTMPVLLEAARTEFRKLERPINDADFRVIEAVKKA